MAEIRFPVGESDFSLVHSVQIGFEAHPHPYRMVISRNISLGYHGQDVKLATSHNIVLQLRISGAISQFFHTPS
jgi:hypothetical protein